MYVCVILLSLFFKHLWTSERGFLKSSISKKTLLFNKKMAPQNSLNKAKEFAEYVVHTLLPNVCDKFFMIPPDESTIFVTYIDSIGVLADDP
jgi:hypothetical protein